MKQFVAQLKTLFRAGDPRRKMLLYALFASIICGVIDFGAPLDSFLRTIRNHVRAQPVSGEIVVVGIDNETLVALKTKNPTTGHIAQLITAIDAEKPKEIYVDFPTDVADGTENEQKLVSALANAKASVSLTAQTSIDALSEEWTVVPPAPEFRIHAKTVTTYAKANFLNYVWELPYARTLDGQPIPSMASAIAEIDRDNSQSSFYLDYSFDPRTIPVISGVAILNSTIKSDIAGKTVVLTPIVDQFGTIKRWPGYQPKPRAFVFVVGAETLKQGSQLAMGWIPMLALVLILCVVQLTTAHWPKRVAAIASTASLVLIPLIAESRMVFLEVAPALILFVWLGIWDAWSSFGNKLRSTNHTSGLANLNALNEIEGADKKSLVVALVRNYAHVRTSVNADKEANLVKQISDRLVLGTGGSKLYQADDGSFAWFVDPAIEPELDNQFEGLHALFRSPVTIDERQIDLDIAFGVDRNFDRSAASRYSSAWIAATEAGNLGLKWKGFDAAKLEDSEWQLSMLGQLDNAIDNGEVWVAYQPQLDVGTNRIYGAEALVRWSHPMKGEIGPDVFIGTAEQHNRIGKLTDFVLNQAISTAAEINRDGIPFIISVNLSPKLLEEPFLVEKVHGLLTKFGLSPACLTLELTETVAIDKNSDVLETLNQLRKIGIGISIDDYGTGFSTLEYLKRVPATEIKIDRSFVRQLAHNESDQLVVRSTVDLAHSLGCKIVAEGVETEGALAKLEAMHCDAVQGYLIGPPMHLSRLLDRLPQRKRRKVA